jgi:hypothetical protein
MSRIEGLENNDVNVSFLSADKDAAAHAYAAKSGHEARACVESASTPDEASGPELGCSDHVEHPKANIYSPDDIAEPMLFQPTHGWAPFVRCALVPATCLRCRYLARALISDEKEHLVVV